MKNQLFAGTIAFTVAVPFAGLAQNASPGVEPYVDKYRITSLEKAACGTDAMRLCTSAYPDQDRLIGCLKTNLPNLSLACSIAFKAGLRRRGMAL